MESFAADLATLIRTPLHDDHVRAMEKRGTRLTLRAGDMAQDPGQTSDHFLYVLDGELEAVDPNTGDRYGDATLGPTQFFGDLAFLNGGKSLMGSRAVRDTTLLSVPRAAMLRLMADMPELSDIVVTVLAARRRKMLESPESGLTLVGLDTSRELRHIAMFASRNRLPWRDVPLDSDEARSLAQSCAIPEATPMVVLSRTTALTDLTLSNVAQALGLDLPIASADVFDVAIVGAGPAGVAAGVYAGAEGLSALVIEDLTIGGQAGTSSRIENYMGFPTGISGSDLVGRGEIQAMKFGTRFAVPRRAAALSGSDGLFHLTLDNDTQVSARAIVVATGVQYRKLPLDRLECFEGNGIYYAATELEARFCRDTDVAVIGGGNSAGQAAMFLARTARHVHVLVRGDSLAASMSDYLLSRLKAHPRITLHTRTAVTALHGDDRLTGVTICDSASGQDWTLKTGGLFIMVGAAPNTGWLSGCVDLDEQGFVLTGSAAGRDSDSPYATSHPGIFAVGDVRAGSTKRVASAVGEGSVVIAKVWAHVRG